MGNGLEMMYEGDIGGMMCLGDEGAWLTALLKRICLRHTTGRPG
jgi:hypothetical protein